MKSAITFLAFFSIVCLSACTGLFDTGGPISIEPGQGTHNTYDHLDSNNNVIDPSSPDNPRVKIRTNYGDMVVELYENKAPVTVQNFLRYVDAGFYDKTIMHRVRKDFMIQGGGFAYNGVKKDSRDPIANEASNGLKNKKYTVAMARTGDPNSAAAQFYINHNDNMALDFRGFSPDAFGYCVFGSVIEGRDTVDRIAHVKCKNSSYLPKEKSEPVKIVKILSIRRVK